MSDNEPTPRRFVAPPDGAPEYVADAPKGVVKRELRSSNEDSVFSVHVTEPPKEQIEKNRASYYGDPHVGHAVEIVLDWLLSDGYNISPRNVPGTDMEQSDEDIAELKLLIERSSFTRVFNDWIERAIVDGHAFMELVVQDGQFKPRILPTQRMHIRTDEYGHPTEYILEPPAAGPDDDRAARYEPDEIAELWFRRDPGEDFGRGLVERARQQAEMLREMEIDWARFVATKAYPPILWKCGTEEQQWTEDQIDNWLQEVGNIEPDSMLAAPHDVEAEVVGATSTSSSAGAMRLEETFNHLERRIITGIGVPSVLANLDSQNQPAEAIMPSFKRRIRRYQDLIRTAVEQQIFKKLLATSINGLDSADEYDGIVPAFEFGEHSSAEKRLEVDKILKLLNNGLLTPEAAARRAGIDPEVELPSGDELNALIRRVRALAGEGDRIQNPAGGHPTDTGGGAESAGGEVVRREDPSSDQSDGRNRKSPTEADTG